MTGSPAGCVQGRMMNSSSLATSSSACAVVKGELLTAGPGNAGCKSLSSSTVSLRRGGKLTAARSGSGTCEGLGFIWGELSAIPVPDTQMVGDRAAGLELEDAIAAGLLRLV